MFCSLAICIAQLHLRHTPRLFFSTDYCSYLLYVFIPKISGYGVAKSAIADLLKKSGICAL